MGNSCSTFYL